MNPSFAIQSIDLSTLTPIVSKLVKNDKFNIVEWSVDQLGGGVGNPVSVGLYRFKGMGQDQEGKSIRWSVILKIIQSPANVDWVNLGEGDDQTHWNYWKREPLIYQSGFLETLPRGLSAPHCFGVVEHPGNMIWLWLEDITESDKEVWTLDHYARIARHLGRFNGQYTLQSSTSPFSWLGKQRIRSWLATIPWQTIPWEQPQMLTRYPKPEVNSFARMLVDHERFLTKMEGLPQTVCHGDTYPTNFMFRLLPDGQQEIVALDWALAGIAPVGADLGQLVFGAQTNLKEVKQTEIDTELYENYLLGLKESGCQFERQLVRFGYKAYAALQVGLFQLFLLSESLKNAEIVMEQTIERPVILECFEVTMANEAYNLLEEI
jgi:hypothetical protein